MNCPDKILFDGGGPASRARGIRQDMTWKIWRLNE